MAMKTVYRTVNGKILSQNRSGTISRLVHDPLGSVIATINTTGSVANQTMYWPYGEVRSGSVASVTAFSFCGTWGYYTSPSGSVYVRARYYRPTAAKWQTVDALWPSEPAYTYGSCSPATIVDWTGLSPMNKKYAAPKFFNCGDAVPCGAPMCTDILAGYAPLDKAAQKFLDCMLTSDGWKEDMEKCFGKIGDVLNDKLKDLIKEYAACLLAAKYCPLTTPEYCSTGSGNPCKPPAKNHCGSACCLMDYYNDMADCLEITNWAEKAACLVSARGKYSDCTREATDEGR